MASNDYQRNTVHNSSENINEHNSLIGSKTEVKIPFKFTAFNYICLGIFTILCNGSSFGTSIIGSQYIYNKYAIKKGIPNGALNTNGSICDQNKSDPIYDLIDEAQKDAAFLSMLQGLATWLPACILVIIYGAYSDRLGRKKTIFVAWVGLLLQMMLLLLMIVLDLPLWTSVIAALFYASGGGFGSMFSGVFSMVADTTSESRRSLGMGVYEGLLGSSVVLSQFLCGSLIQTWGFRVSIICISITYSISGIILCFIPETLSSSDQQHTFKNPAHMVRLASRLILIDKLRGVLLILLMVSIFTIFMGLVGTQSVDTLYFLNRPFCFLPAQLGIFQGLRSGIMQGVSFIALLCLRTRVADITLLIMGCLSSCGQFIMDGLASSFDKSIADNIVYSSIAVCSLSGLVMSMYRTIMSKLVTDKEQGVASASIACLQNLAILTSSVSYSAVYKSTLELLPGFVYFMNSAIILISILVALIYQLVYIRLYRNRIAICDNADINQSSGDIDPPM